MLREVTCWNVTSLSNRAIMKLLRHVLEHSYFSWDGQLYRQVSGLPMGSQISPILANLYMEDLEHKVLCTAWIIPKLYLRYVDDTFVIWDKTRGEQADFLHSLNSQHPDIILTEELESDRSLAFLDVTIKRPLFDSESQQVLEPLQISVYRKPTHTDRYLQFGSSHPLSLKRNLFHGLWLRAQRLLHNFPSQLNLKLHHLKEAFCHPNNPYPEFLIDRWLEDFRLQLIQNPHLLKIRPRLDIANMFDDLGQQSFLAPNANEYVERLTRLKRIDVTEEEDLAVRIGGRRS